MHYTLQPQKQLQNHCQYAAVEHKMNKMPFLHFKYDFDKRCTILGHICNTAVFKIGRTDCQE